MGGSVVALPIVLRRLKPLLNRLGMGNDRLRRRRMEAFVHLVDPPPHARILDLGGTEHLWRWIDHSFDVTILNLPYGEVGASPDKPGADGACRHVTGDATELDRQQFPDKSYDVVFSNSVIEHVECQHKRE